MPEIFYIDDYAAMQQIAAKAGDIVYVNGDTFCAVANTPIIDSAPARQESTAPYPVRIRNTYKPTFPKVKGRGGKFKKY